MSKVRFAAIFGRFQPFHLTHLQYALTARTRCEHLLIGLTQVFGEDSQAFPGAAHRSTRESNPLTFLDRTRLVTAALTEQGGHSWFTCIPFPIERPELVVRCVPSDVLCFSTDDDEWTTEKARRLREEGFQVEFLDVPEPLEKRSGTQIREMIRNDGPWRSYVPEATIPILEELRDIRF